MFLRCYITKFQNIFNISINLHLKILFCLSLPQSVSTSCRLLSCVILAHRTWRIYLLWSKCDMNQILPICMSYIYSAGLWLWFINLVKSKSFPQCWHVETPVAMTRSFKAQHCRFIRMAQSKCSTTWPGGMLVVVHIWVEDAVIYPFRGHCYLIAVYSWSIGLVYHGNMSMVHMPGWCFPHQFWYWPWYKPSSEKRPRKKEDRSHTTQTRLLVPYLEWGYRLLFQISWSFIHFIELQHPHHYTNVFIVYSTVVVEYFEFVQQQIKLLILM